MKTLTSFLRPALMLAVLPATLTVTSCSDDDDAAPDQGRVLVSHAAASANVRVKALANDNELGQLDYGQSSAYINTGTGARTININVASSNQTAVSRSVTVDKDQAYSIFAYAPTATTVDLLPVTDDLTVPAAGQAKVRVVHLGLNAPTPVKLSQETVSGSADVPGISAAFGAASSFATIPANSYNLLVTTGAGSTRVVAVGDGTGTGTGVKSYEGGKIYTIVVRGIAGSLDPNLQPKAVIIQNN